MINSIRLYPWSIDMNELKSAGISDHMKHDRSFRLKAAQAHDKCAGIDRAFLIDRDHRSGPEIHAVSEHGIIYILSYKKFCNHMGNAMITVLIARPGQIKRLYRKCGLKPCRKILDSACVCMHMHLNI